MNGILLAFAALIFFGISNFGLKKVTSHLDALSIAVYKGIPQVGLLLVVFLWYGFTVPFGITWLYILLFGFIGAVAYYSFIRSIQDGMVSISVALVQGYVVLTAILSSLFLKETLAPIHYLALGIIVCGVIALSMNARHIVFGKTWYHSLITLCGWGFIFFLMKYTIAAIGPIATAFYQEAAILVFLLLFTLCRTATLDLRTAVTYRRWLLTAALASALGIIFMLISAASEFVAVTVGIISCSPVVVLILARLFLKEKLTKVQIAAIGIVTLGLALLAGVSAP